MTRDETIKMLAILKAAYPNSYKGMTKDEANGMIAVWTMQFADMPADIVLMALNKLISTSQFPPAISEVKKKISSLHWEAYDMIGDKTTAALLQDEEIAKYQRIYEITKRMKINTNLEPTLTEMMNGGTQKYLNG
jgi:hypothetical protein